PLRPAGPKADAIHTVRDHSATPTIRISFVKIRVCANKAFAPKKSVLAAVRVSWPIAILSYEDVGRAVARQSRVAQRPVGEWIAAGHRHIIFGRTILL